MSISFEGALKKQELYNQFCETIVSFHQGSYLQVLKVELRGPLSGKRRRRAPPKRQLYRSAKAGSVSEKRSWCQVVGLRGDNVDHWNLRCHWRVGRDFLVLNDWSVCASENLLFTFFCKYFVAKCDTGVSQHLMYHPS